MFEVKSTQTASSPVGVSILHSISTAYITNYTAY